MVPEAGSPTAVALGVGYFTLLAAAGLTTGLGALTLLRYPADPLRRLLLAPFAATVVWALGGNLLVRFGLTMVQATPLIALASLALTVLGVRAAVRLYRRPVVATTLVAGLGLVVGLVAWPAFAPGLTAHLGSANLDTFNYTSIATAYWHLGLDPPSAASLFFQRYADTLERLGPGRNHTFVLLAFFSPLVEPGEPVHVRNLFVCWALLVLAASLAFYRAAWAESRERDQLSSAAILGYVAVTVGIGWAVVPALVGNWDNALLVSLGPVLAGMARGAPSGLGYPVFLGASIAYGVYTYPELVLFLGLFLLPLFAGTLAAAARSRDARVYGLAGGVTLLLLAPGVIPLGVYLETQRARRTRPGGTFAAGLTQTPFDPSGWWALGAEHGYPGWPTWASLAGLCLGAVAAAGVARLVVRGNRAEPAALGLVAASVGYFVFVNPYSYAVYKILSVSWWLVGRCLVEGFAWVVEASGTGSRTGVIRRVRQRAARPALVGLVLVSLFTAERHRRDVYFPPDGVRRQPTVAAIVRLRAAAIAQSPADVLVATSSGDRSVLAWMFYAIRDAPLRAYNDPSIEIPGGPPWRRLETLPDSFLVPSGDVEGGRVRFRTPEFALADAATVPLIVRVDSPNRMEGWGTWLGTHPITIAIVSRAGLPVTLSFGAAPGPSLPETQRRTLVLEAGSRTLARLAIDQATRVAVPFVTAGGRQTLTLWTPDAPSVPVMPNGDRRPLLVSIRDVKLAATSPGR